MEWMGTRAKWGHSKFQRVRAVSRWTKKDATESIGEK